MRQSQGPSRICITCFLKLDKKDYSQADLEGLISDGEDIACQHPLHIQPNIVDPSGLTALVP